MGPVIHIVGFDHGRPDYGKIQSFLTTSVALVAGRSICDRLLARFSEESLGRLIPVVPLASCVVAIAEALTDGDVLVLASGDPLFFGIGRRLLKSFARDTIQFHPELSSMQLAFARFRLPWEDAEFISLHGRTVGQLATRLLRRPKVFLLTDALHSPNAIATQLLAESESEMLSGLTLHVAECLGSPEERLRSGSLSQIAGQHFVEPNVMILLNPRANERPDDLPLFGLREEEISHSRGLLTKNEVRAAALHALRLPRHGVLWDVGAGSGSVGLEVARLFPGITVFSVEKEGEQCHNIRCNKRKFGVWNMNLVQGTAPDVLQGLPIPDRIFVGGSGGNLREILLFCASRLALGGSIVLNAVIEKTARSGPEILYDLGFEVEIKEVSVQRIRYPSLEVEPFNPITIIIGSKLMQEIADE